MAHLQPAGSTATAPLCSPIQSDAEQRRSRPTTFEPNTSVTKDRSCALCTRSFTVAITIPTADCSMNPRAIHNGRLPTNPICSTAIENAASSFTRIDLQGAVVVDLCSASDCRTAVVKIVQSHAKPFYIQSNVGSIPLLQRNKLLQLKNAQSAIGIVWRHIDTCSRMTKE